MPILDLFKRAVPKVGTSPADSDSPANVQTAFENFSETIHAPIPVVSDTEASQIASNAPSGAFPLFVWHGPQQAMKIKETTDAPWEVVAGQGHGIQTECGNASHAPGTAWLARHEKIIRASEGWAITASGDYITVPAEGLYLMSVRFRVGELARVLGRTFVEFMVDSSIYRVGAPDDNHVSATAVLWVPRGARIATRLYHQTGGPFTVTGEFTAVQLINPRWEVLG